ncbi:MAG: hypothetical protein K8T90_19990 [Planctomycetes bacterium]|nr:hypothetical protein [Planctomycetota bacterium]
MGSRRRAVCAVSRLLLPLAFAACGGDSAEPRASPRPIPQTDESPIPPAPSPATSPDDGAPDLSGPLHPRTAADRARYDQLSRPHDAQTSVRDLRGRTHDAIRRALVSSAELITFVTAPETPFADRAAAALQGAATFDPGDVPRLLRALGDLRAEERVHRWGLRPNPTEALYVPDPRPWPGVVARLREWSDAERTRTILGHAWRAPTTVTAWFPDTDDAAECAAAPWPLQAKIALKLLLRSAAPKMDVQEEAWLDAAFRIPCGTDDEALLFVEAAQAVTHHVTPRVLARYRALVTDARFPESARRVLSSVGESSRLALHAAPETVAQFQVLLIDALTGPHDERIRREAAFQVPRVRERWGGSRHPECATLILLLSRRGLDPADTDEWARLYCFLFPACRALDAPPFVTDDRMDPAGAAERIAAYRTWFDAHRGDLELRAAAERPALDAARARLLALDAK